MDEPAEFPIPDNTLPIIRRPDTQEIYPEIKDPSIVKISGSDYRMFASVGRSDTQQWIIGRFAATSILGPWQETTPAQVRNVSGPQMCAPAVIYREANSEPWTMYVQTACFEENGIIARATSKDGEYFSGVPEPIFTKYSLTNPQSSATVGLYDAGISEVTWQGENYYCLVFSGYRRIGCGDLYVSLKPQNAPEEAWSPPQCLLRQEDVPFHNHPVSGSFEWGLEGAEIIELDASHYLLIGVCFLPGIFGRAGTRQRVFFAYGKSPLGPFIPAKLAFTPHLSGENGHPGILVENGKVSIIYQERHGQGAPWHLRYKEFDTSSIIEEMETFGITPKPQSEIAYPLGLHDTPNPLFLP